MMTIMAMVATTIMILLMLLVAVMIKVLMLVLEFETLLANGENKSLKARTLRRNMSSNSDLFSANKAVFFDV